MKPIVTTVIPISGIHKKNSSNAHGKLLPSDAQGAPNLQLTSPWPTPLLRTQHDVTWYHIITESQNGRGSKGPLWVI